MSATESSINHHSQTSCFCSTRGTGPLIICLVTCEIWLKLSSITAIYRRQLTLISISKVTMATVEMDWSKCALSSACRSTQVLHTCTGTSVPGSQMLLHNYALRPIIFELEEGHFEKSAPNDFKFWCFANFPFYSIFNVHHAIQCQSSRQGVKAKVTNFDLGQSC